ASNAGNVMPRCQSAVWTSFSPTLPSAAPAAASATSSNHELRVQDRLPLRGSVPAFIGMLSPAAIALIVARLEPSQVRLDRLQLALRAHQQRFDPPARHGAGRGVALAAAALDAAHQLLAAALEDQHAVLDEALELHHGALEQAVLEPGDLALVEEERLVHGL